MKRSEMLVHMQRAYGIRHVMVESGYITVKDFMDELLTYMEGKGMIPPAFELKKTGKGCLCSMRDGCEECDPYNKYYENKWEPET